MVLFKFYSFIYQNIQQNKGFAVKDKVEENFLELVTRT